jgi:hypothetical protein
MESGHALIVERDFATYENIEDDAETPDVDFWAGVDLCVEQFRGGEVEGTTECGKMSEGIVEVG